MLEHQGNNRFFSIDLYGRLTDLPENATRRWIRRFPDEESLLLFNGPLPNLH